MISKVFNGHSFYHACRYVVNKPGANVLETEGVRGHDFRLMAQDFLSQQALRPAKEQACFHGILSFYPGENPGDEKITEIAKTYFQRLGIENTQYAITKHTDRQHLHVHLVANMVNDEGGAISDSWIGWRGKRIAQQLTQEYGLIPAVEKNLTLTNEDALSQSEANKYRVYKAIHDALSYCLTLEHLEKQLKEKGIETQYKYKGQSKELQGVSFKIKEDCFKGSRVDRQYSLNRLENTLAQQRQRIMQQEQQQAQRYRGLHR